MNAVWRVDRESIHFLPFRFPCHDWLLGTFSRGGFNRVFILIWSPSGIGLLEFSILGGGGRVSLSSQCLQGVYTYPVIWFQNITRFVSRD